MNITTTYDEAMVKAMIAEAVAKERNSWPAEMEAMERQVNILTDALAEQPAHHTEQHLEMVDAYCKAWEQSFTADNPFNTVKMTAEDRKHIEAGLRAALSEQPAQQNSSWCMKMNGCKTKCEDCPDEVPKQPAQPLTDEENSNLFDSLIDEMLEHSYQGSHDSAEKVANEIRRMYKAAHGITKGNT